MSKRLDPKALQSLESSISNKPKQVEEPVQAIPTEQTQLINKSFSLTKKQVDFIFSRSMTLSQKHGKRISESEALRQLLQDVMNNANA